MELIDKYLFDKDLNDSLLKITIEKIEVNDYNTLTLHINSDNVVTFNYILDNENKLGLYRICNKGGDTLLKVRKYKINAHEFYCDLDTINYVYNTNITYYIPQSYSYKIKLSILNNDIIASYL